MGKIYIDVSSTVKVPFTTGIQRGTKNVVKELLKSMPERLELICWSEGAGKPSLLPHGLFEAYLSKKIEREELLQELEKKEKWSVSRLVPEDTFLEIDAGWGRFTPPRPWLYRKIKERGAKLLVFVHDVIPVTYPQFCDGETVIWFLGYLGAVLNHADGIITSTQAVQDEITRIAERLGISEARAYSVASFYENFSFAAKGKYVIKVCDGTACHVRKSAPILEAVISAGLILFRMSLTKKRYQASRGKNSSCLWAPSSQGRIIACSWMLSKKDYLKRILVLSWWAWGGWNTAMLQNRLQQSPYAGKQFFWFDRVGDSTLAWLYAHAYLVGISTFEEGFCLPVAEALQQGAPVLAADIPVIREVGKDYCVYFAPNDEGSFVKKVSELLEDEGKYQTIKKHAEEFQAFTWSDTTANIVRAVDEIPCLSKKNDTANFTLPAEDAYEEYRRGYARCHGLQPVFGLGRQDGELRFTLPEYGLFPAGEKLCLEMELDFPEGEERLSLFYQLLGKRESEEYPFGTSHWQKIKLEAKAGLCHIELEGVLPDNKGAIIFKTECEGETCYGRLPVALFSEEGGLTAFEVWAAYRYLLGRQPDQRENWRALYEYESPDELREALLSAPEFSKVCGQ